MGPRSDLAAALARVAARDAARLRRGRALVVAGVALSVAALLGAACGAGPTPAQQADVAAYQAAMLLCIEKAPTRYDADTCRAHIRAAFGVLDAGGGS